MKAKIAGGIFVMVVIVLGGVLLWQNREDTNKVDQQYSELEYDEGVHLHAAFHIYIDGKLQDYSGLQYMFIGNCTEGDTGESPETIQIEKAHLHDQIGDVVHVHKAEVYWKDLLINLDIDMDLLNNGVKGYVDGVSVADILMQPISAYSRVVILVGDNANLNPLEIQALVPSVDRIKEVEAISEGCSS